MGLYDGDGKWHSATILTKLQNGMCRVNYTGYNEEATVAPSSHMRKVPLMEGWIELTDADSGHEYYMHQDTGLTQWEKPTYQSEQIRKGMAGRGSKVLQRNSVDLLSFSSPISKYSGIGGGHDEGRITRHIFNSTATKSALSEKQEKEEMRRRYTTQVQMSAAEKDVYASRRR